MKKTPLLTIIVLSVILPSLSSGQNPILWGTTTEKGLNSFGTIFKFNSATDTTVGVHQFANDSTDGSLAFASLFKATNGLLYGMTSGGGASPGNLYGTIFSYDVPTGSETDIHDFSGSVTDGSEPAGNFIQLNDSLLCGFAQNGGLYNGGIIFNFNIMSHTLTDRFDFGYGPDGYKPVGTPLLVNDSMLYGMTYNGGQNGVGTIISFNMSSGIEMVVHTFGNGTDGYRPMGSLIRAYNGLLYGLASGGGGTGNSGTLFSLNVSNDSLIIVHNFTGIADGSAAMGSLLQASDSLLYGTTQMGGPNDVGTIFRYNISTGRDTVLWNFGNGTDGQSPQNSLLQASNGLLYGMTPQGGDGLGTIFSYNISTGHEAVLWKFHTTTDGGTPLGDLIEDDTGASLAVNVVPVASHFLMFPNPANIMAIVKLDNIASLEVSDYRGRKILSAETLGLTQYRLSVRDWVHGIYFVTVISPNGRSLHSVLVVQ